MILVIDYVSSVGYLPSLIDDDHDDDRDRSYLLRRVISVTDVPYKLYTYDVRII